MRLLPLLALSIVVGCGSPDDPAVIEPVDDSAYVETASFDGEWSAEAMPPDSDSVLVSMRMTASDGPDGWALLFDHLDAPVEAVDVSVDGGVATAVFEPYSSALRDGLTVDTLRTTVTLNGDDFDGTFTARYSDGEVIEGRIRGYR